MKRRKYFRKRLVYFQNLLAGEKHEPTAHQGCAQPTTWMALEIEIMRFSVANSQTRRWSEKVAWKFKM